MKPIDSFTIEAGELSIEFIRIASHLAWKSTHQRHPEKYGDFLVTEPTSDLRAEFGILANQCALSMEQVYGVSSTELLDVLTSKLMERRLI